VRGLSETDVLDLMDRDLDRQGAAARALLAFACPELGDADLDRQPLGHRDRQLIRLREATFGTRLELRADCPRCGDMLELELDTRDLIVPDPSPRAAARLRRFDIAGRRLRLRPLTGADVAAALHAPAWDAARDVILRRCCSDCDTGLPADPDAFAEDDKAAIARRLERLDPQADLTLDVACFACGEGWRPLLDVAEVFWREIRTRAGLIVGDIHDLARAFHWTEAEILALSPKRRQTYLSLVR
jgi:hypothetical protein